MRLVHCIVIASLLLPSYASTQTRVDRFIHVGGGDSLDATYFIPNQSAPPAGFPGILFVHGFELSKSVDTANCRIYAAAGYITLCYSVRGHGLSSGVSTIMSTQERSDLSAVIAFMRQIPGIDTSSIGISGGSQGGLHGLWAVADQLPIAAVSSDVIVPRWATDMLMNGSIRRTTILLLKSKTVRYPASRDTLWDLVRVDDYDRFSAIWAPPRDVDTVQLNARTVPTLRLLKWQDHYFAADDGIAAFERYGGARKLYLGTRGHFSDQVESEKPVQDSAVTRWFNYYLKGLSNGVPSDPRYTYAFSTLPIDTAGYFTWSHRDVPQWPPGGVVPFRFYLAPDSSLRYTPSPSSGFSTVLENKYLNPVYTFDTAYIEGFRGSRFDVLLPQQRLVFDSPPINQEITWIGTPRMSLHVESSDSVFPLHAQVYEVDSLGTKYFINRINFTARHWTPGSAGVVDVRGIPHAHRFRRGSRVRIELTNIDKSNRLYLGSHPFVLPLFRNCSVTVFADGAHQSFIELPLLGTPTSAEEARPIPSGFTLAQNYPNPFNPATRVRFDLPSQSNVLLEVFDVLGRKIVTLAEGVRTSGSHEVMWDAGDKAGGVYFCRLTTRDENGSVTFQASQKMILMR